MNSKHTEWKVGLFVLIGVVLLALLMLNFSKGFTALKSTYELRLRTASVGGIKQNASVLMSGVPVGVVKEIALAPDGKSVVVTLKLEQRYQIHNDAVFLIEQAGFLGDQYISVSPQENKGAILKHGDEVQCQAPFDLQEAARSALGLIKRVDQTVASLNEAVTRVDRTLLSPAALGDLTNSFANFNKVSGKAVTTLDNANETVSGVNRLINTNAPSISRSVVNVEQFTAHLNTITNLVRFSDQLSELARELRQTVATNRNDLTSAVKNMEESSELVKQLLTDLNAGKGLAGNLLKNEETSQQMSLLMNNLTTLSSNLNRFGLLYKPKPVKSNATASPFFYPAQQRNR